MATSGIAGRTEIERVSSLEALEIFPSSLSSTISMMYCYIYIYVCMRMYMYIKLILLQYIRVIFKCIGSVRYNMDSYITWKHILGSIRIDKSGHSLAHSTDNPFNVMQPWSIYGTPAPIKSRSDALYRFQP